MVLEQNLSLIRSNAMKKGNQHYQFFFFFSYFALEIHLKARRSGCTNT